MISKSGMRQYNDTSVTSSNYNSVPIVTCISACFELKSTDVIVGKGLRSKNHAGNKMLGRIVASRLAEYDAAPTKNQKTDILSNIIACVRKNGGFLKQDVKTGQWFEVGDFAAREKIARLFRKALHRKYKSSNESKKRQRLDRSSKHHNAATSLSHYIGDAFRMPEIESSASMEEYVLPDRVKNEKAIDIDSILEPVPISEMCRVGREIPFEHFLDYQSWIATISS